MPSNAIAAILSSHQWLPVAVTATGNHWWLDGIAAIALLGIALRIDDYVRPRLFQSITNKN